MSAADTVITAGPMRGAAELTPANRAGILCNDPAFQRFSAIRSGFPGQQFTTTAAAEYVRGQCDITTRRDLNTNPAAAEKFAALQTAFDAWRGRIAAQR